MATDPNLYRAIELEQHALDDDSLYLRFLASYLSDHDCGLNAAYGDEDFNREQHHELLAGLPSSNWSIRCSACLGIVFLIST
jgi:hypothetical protein